MYRRFIAALFAFIVVSVPAQQMQPLPTAACEVLLPYGRPLHATLESIPICRHAYALEYSLHHKTPVWVAHLLRPEYTVGCLERDDTFEADLSVPLKHRVYPTDFRSSGYDMGHMVSSADMSWDALVMRETFIMTNIAPQLPGFNRGIWRRLEDQTRAWAQERKHPLLVYTGPIYSGEHTVAIERDKIILIPDEYFKVIVDTETREVLAFRIPHKPSSGPLSAFLTDTAQIGAVTGLKFPLPQGYIGSSRMWPSKLKSTRLAKSIICATGGF